MLFSKNGEHYITSRRYIYSSGTRIFHFGAKKFERTLKIEFENKEGEFNISVLNITDYKDEQKSSDLSGTFEYTLKENKKYRVVIQTKKTIGHYKIHIVDHK